MAAMRSIAGAGAMARLPLLLLLADMARAYIPPDGPDLNTAAITEVGQYPGVHADLLATSLRLLEADGRSAAAETYADPHDLAALHDGLRQASTGAGEFGIELYNSVGVAMRNTLSHFYNPETREGRTCAIPDAPAAARHAPVRALCCGALWPWAWRTACSPRRGRPPLRPPLCNSLLPIMEPRIEQLSR